MSLMSYWASTSKALNSEKPLFGWLVCYPVLLGAPFNEETEHLRRQCPMFGGCFVKVDLRLVLRPLIELEAVRKHDLGLEALGSQHTILFAELLQTPYQQLR